MKKHKKVQIIVAIIFLTFSTCYWFNQQAMEQPVSQLPSDPEIIQLIDQAMADLSTFKTTTASSSLHTQIAQLVETYNTMWPHFKKAHEGNSQLANQGTSTPLGWCDCEGMPINWRMLFVIKTLHDIKSSFPDRTNTNIYWVSLGAGNLLQDFLILQQLVLDSYKKIDLSLIDGHFLNDQVPVVQAFNSMIKLLVEHMYAVDKLNKKPVARIEITVHARPHVNDYLQHLHPNAKPILITLADVHPLHDDAGKDPKSINVISVNNLYDIFLSPNGTNFAYIKGSTPFYEDVEHIVGKRMRNIDEIKEMLAKTEKEYPRIYYAANAFYDLKKLLDTAAPHALAYTIYPLYRAEKTETLIQKIDPISFNPDDFIIEQLDAEGEEPLNIAQPTGTP